MIKRSVWELQKELLDLAVEDAVSQWENKRLRYPGQPLYLFYSEMRLGFWIAVTTEFDQRPCTSLQQAGCEPLPDTESISCIRHWLQERVTCLPVIAPASSEQDARRYQVRFTANS